LILPAGWHLPLAWIPAARSGLPDVRAVPYVDATQSPAPAADLCVEKNGIKLCLQAATTTADGTSVLVGATPTNPALGLSPWLQGLVWQSRTNPVTLQDEQGKIYPLDIKRPPLDGTLFFPPLSGAHTLTLTIPEVYANVNIPQQELSVDVGADPQPGDVIPLDANIQVLGATVHFSKATFIGDGTSTLRLTLNADGPIQMVDGLTPEALELGRPARVDDLYGGGELVGGKGLFVELIQGGTKLTGVLDLPIVSATVIVQGPFTFTFNLSDLPALTPTPLVANPNVFAPGPSPTPMSLDNYVYSGQALQAGDLLYATWNGSQSDVYRYNPASGTAPVLFMTLPGRVFSIHLHTDRAGLDYLTGTFNPDMVVETTALYTLRFSDPRPRLLHTSSEGIITYPVWSFDGRLMAFAFQLPDPGELWPRVGWIDMNCRSSGECPVQLLDAPAEFRLSASAFSPQGYWLAMDGVDTTYAAGEIYLLQFDNNAQPGQVQNITNTGGVSDGGPQWIAGNKLAWNCAEPNPSDIANGIPNICLQDISSGSASPQKIFTNNDFDFVFGLSSQGNYFWQDVFIRIDPGSYQMWLHDQKGDSRMLTASPWFDEDYGKPVFSLNERYLAYFSESYYDKSVPETLHIADTATGKELATSENINPVGWMGWVP
jgi:Tol biopolymer transport system component